MLPRFSRLAFASVAALVVSGTVQAVREVESPSALFVTTYGWLLVAKLVLVLVLLAAAGVSRVWVQQRLGVRGSRPGARRSLTAHAFAAVGGGDTVSREDDDSPEDDEAADLREHLQSESAAEHVPDLRRSVLVEVAVAAVVLAVSAVLVGTPPARSAVAQPVDVVLPLQSSAGAGGQRAGVGRPGRSRAQHAARLPLRRRRPADPARGDQREPHRGGAADRPAGRRPAARPDRATTSATGWPSPAPAPGPSP